MVHPYLRETSDKVFDRDGAFAQSVENVSEYRMQEVGWNIRDSFGW